MKKNLQKNYKRIISISFLFFVFLFTAITFVITFGQDPQNFLNYDNDKLSGVVENVVHINDLDANYYYYKGLNYTESSTGTLPSGENQNLYTDDQLVEVEIVYSSEDLNFGEVGYVSLTELQDTFIYYKILPIQSGPNGDYVEIELIENPFTNRPEDKGFNGWTTENNNVEFTFDKDYYIRSARVPVSYDGDVAEKVEIEFNASWVAARISEVNGGNGWASAFNDLADYGMQYLETYSIEHLPLDMTGYFTQTILGWNGQCNGMYDANGNLQTGNCRCRDWGGCTYYELVESEYYDENITYYELNGSMQVVDPSGLPFETEEAFFNDYNDDSLMTGLFRIVTIPNSGSLAGFYTEDGEYLSSGTCNSAGGCDRYELIGYRNDEDELETLDREEDYYYLSTRDTNIIVMTGNRSDAWSSSEDKPFTLTGIHNGTNHNATWSTNVVVRAFNDTNIENINALTSQSQNNSDPPTGTGTIRTFYGNWQNVRLGRGIQSGNNATFQTVLGGNNNATGSSGNITKYRLIIESGNYSTFSIGNGGGTATNHLEARAIYGNDYDKVTNNNDNLDLNYCASGSWGGNVYASSNTGIIFDLVVKSGSYGSSQFDYTTGIYVGGRRGGTHYAARRVKVEGGWIYNLIGGPLTASNRGNLNDSYINVVGGEIDAITGGAGRSATYGHRIIQVTGGQINYAIFGGSNGVEGSGSDGTVIGDSFIYLGGYGVVGDPNLVSSSSTIYGAEAGSVFGIGNGRSGFSSIGSMVNSNIIIDGNAVVNNNVYGGGNFGATGISSTSSTTNSNITVLNGSVLGSIYGGGNNNGAGNTSVDATINMVLNGGSVSGSVYGGSNVSGTIYGDVNIDVISGLIEESVYGGGRGGYVDSSNQGTYVRNNIEVNVGNESTGPEILGDVYGGSAYGTVNSTSNSPSFSSDIINVNINNGQISGSIYGGAKGDASHHPYVAGRTYLTINGGEMSSVFGANDLSGEVLGGPTIHLNNGIVDNVYGGGNQVGSSATNIYLDGSTVNSIHGGSNLSGDVPSSNIYLISGTSDNVYGGNNIGGKTSTTNIALEGATIQNIFGGGNQADVDTTNINLTSGSATNVYGGGAEASVMVSSNVILNGGSITNIYGGSNLSGDIPVSNITLVEGTADNVYGGNNIGGKTNETNIETTAVSGEASLPEDENIAYIYNPSAPDLPNNTTPCEVEGMEFTHITDKRNGTTYPVTQINNQCFMASNLNYTGNGCLSNSWTTGAPYNACRSHSTPYGTQITYQWAAAMNGQSGENSRGLCPVDWYIPSDDGYKELEAALGMSQGDIDSTGYRGSGQGTMIKDDQNWNGTNDYGFSALPTGYQSTTGATTGVDAFALWWTSSQSGSDAWGRYMHDTNANINRSTLSQAFGFAIRCVQGTFTGEMPIPEEGEGPTIGTIYGGGNQATVDNTSINLNAGVVTTVFGGGAEADVLEASNIVLNDTDVTTIYGGSNLSGNIPEANITINNGSVETIYGGNNAGGKTSETNISLNSGSASTIYGGGNLAEVDITNISLNSGSINNVYGGGAEADVLVSTNINLNGPSLSNIYGGSNLDGNIHESNIILSSGSSTNVYGGNNLGGQTTTTNIEVLSGNYTNIYGGGNEADTGVSNIDINLSSGVIDYIYGGGNQAGVGETNVDVFSGSIGTIYGGSNQSGVVSSSNVLVDGSSVTLGDIYGGNNLGGQTGETNVELRLGEVQNVYGGGNQAEVTNDTNLLINETTVNEYVYGGGNEAIVGDSTIVRIVDAHIGASVYAGGNGQTAIVEGDTTLNVEGSTFVQEHVFGGGNAAATGTQTYNNSKGTLNISGATILGNVYGGANTSVLYGTTEINIGFGIFEETLEEAEILIEGTVFGGGEANAEGSEEYDFSFISVTNGISINIDGDSPNSLDILGSIFGSGNASSTTGFSEINISNYGSVNNNKQNISIQRADEVVIDNSYIELFGATDRTNEYSSVLFSISRVKELKLKNNSSIYLETGANLLEKVSSLVDVNDEEVKAEVTIDENGTVTRNVDNRIYMLSGRNLNIATNEAVTSYGEVDGMTFFGMYTRDFEGNVNEAFYSHDYENGDTVGIGEFYHFADGSYVLGRHKTNHDINVDGFYTSYEDEENEGVIQMDYIIPTPEDSNYYMWVIGEAISSYDVTLTASKYSTLGTHELPLINFSEPNTTFTLLGVNYDYLDPEIELIRQNDVPRINMEGNADSVMSLVMKTSNTGWLTVGETNFLTEEENPIYGTVDYVSENSSVVPSLLFYIYHSKNLETDGDMGLVTLSLLAVTPIDDLTNEVERININLDLSRILYTTDQYEGAMTPGEEHDMFVTTSTDITTSSTLSAYYSLFVSSEDPYYEVGDHRAMVSSFVLPENTKLTMIDLTPETPEYYYYVVSSQDVSEAQSEYAMYGEASYPLSRFIRMGSTSGSNNYNDEEKNNEYYNDELNFAHEEFVFMLDFSLSSIEEDKMNNTLLIELRNEESQTLVNVLGIQHSDMTYNLFHDKNAVIELNTTLNKENIYLGDIVNLDVTTNFVQQSHNSRTIHDTEYYDNRLGLKLSIYDSNGNPVDGPSLMGVDFVHSGKTYYPRMDGTIRMNIAPRVANVSSRITIDTTNSDLPSDDYTIVVDSFGSPDGIYFGLESSDTSEQNLNILNNIYGLNVELPDNNVIIDKNTGQNSLGEKRLNFNIEFSSGLAEPAIRVSLKRRLYTDVYSSEFELVDLSDYIINNLILMDSEKKEYLFRTYPLPSQPFTLNLEENLVSGTYKVIFSVYDGNNYIGEVSKYVIIK